MRRLLVIVAALLVCAPAFAKAPAHKNVSANFVRLLKDGQSPSALQISISRFRSPDGRVTVDLVGAIHVGEKSYYQQLNTEFKKYDAVLYELIAAKEDSGGRPIPVPGEADNPLSMMQSGLKQMLGLRFQLDDVDYRPKNFVHADISPDELSKSMAKRGESFQAIFVRLLKAGLDSPSAVSDQDISELDLVGIFLRGPSARDKIIMRRILADSFTDLDNLGEALNGPGGSTLLGVRNQKALAVLKEQVRAGKKNLAIFYGVAHMPDMAARLTRGMGYKPVDIRWLNAWDLKMPVPKSSP